MPCPRAQSFVVFFVEAIEVIDFARDPTGNEYSHDALYIGEVESAVGDFLCRYTFSEKSNEHGCSRINAGNNTVARWLLDYQLTA